MSKPISVALLIGAITVMANDASAVTFKMANWSSRTLRMTVHDRGEWRPWVECPPGFWGDVALNVTRDGHQVAIEEWNGNGWHQIHYGNHGSRLFTRVVEAVDAGQGLVLAWWDEPPGCRDWPPRPGLNEGTCLKPSGWLWGEFEKAVREAAMKAALVYLGM